MAQTALKSVATLGDRIRLYHIAVVTLRLFVLGAWTIVSVWLGSNAGLSVTALLLVVYGAGAILALWLGTLVIAFVQKRKVVRWWLDPLVVATALLAIGTGTAFRVRFLISKAALQHYVVNWRPGTERRDDLKLVGLFSVRETERLSGGAVRLITTSCMFDDCGLVFSPHSKPPRIGEDTYRSIDDTWWLWERSW